MRYFKLRISNHPNVEANIAINTAHLDIYKKILRIQTDRGFGNSLKRFISDELERGQNPYVLKASLEHNLSNILASIAGCYLGALFGETEKDDITEQDSPAGNASAATPCDKAAPQNNVIQFSDLDS